MGNSETTGEIAHNDHTVDLPVHARRYTAADQTSRPCAQVVLVEACRDGKHELLECCLKRGANINGTAGIKIGFPGLLKWEFTGLGAASYMNRVIIVRRLLACHYIDVNKKVHSQSNELGMLKQYKNTALHWAIYNNSTEAICALLEDERIDVNIRNIDDATALIMAVEYSQDRTVERLLRSPGIDVNATKGSEGSSALCIAVSKNQTEITRFLLNDTRVKVNDIDQLSFHLACHGSEPHIVRMFLEHQRVDPKVRDPDGNTALHAVVMRGATLDIQTFEKVRLLLNDGRLDPRERNHFGQRAFELATMRSEGCPARNNRKAAILQMLVNHQDEWQERERRVIAMSNQPVSTVFSRFSHTLPSTNGSLSAGATNSGVNTNDESSSSAPTTRRRNGRRRRRRATSSVQVVEKKDCMICVTGKADYAIIPCGHVALCGPCSLHLLRCPLCRGPKEGTLHIFL